MRQGYSRGLHQGLWVGAKSQDILRRLRALSPFHAFLCAKKSYHDGCWMSDQYEKEQTKFILFSALSIKVVTPSYIVNWHIENDKDNRDLLVSYASYL